MPSAFLVPGALRPLLAAALLMFSAVAPAFGQTWLTSPPPEEAFRQRVVIPELAYPLPVDADADLRPHKPRPWLFQMPARSLDDRVWISSEDDPPGSSDGVDGDERFQIWSGWDNPFMDFKFSGDGGGVGYEKLYSQLLLADYGSGSCLLNCQATEPAGIQFNGVSYGPTVVRPSFSWFHDLAGGATLQSFVGTSTRANLQSIDNLGSNVQYGMALLSPLPVSVDSKQFFLFVEALGRSRVESMNGQAPPGGWQLLPGLSWQSSQRCWISGGVMMPFGASRTQTGLWHVTCSWHF